MKVDKKMLLRIRLQDIRNHPHRHRHPDADSLIACNTIEGEIQKELVQAHIGITPINLAYPKD
jgi:hypothetical protein